MIGRLYKFDPDKTIYVLLKTSFRICSAMRNRFDLLRDPEEKYRRGNRWFNRYWASIGFETKPAH